MKNVGERWSERFDSTYFTNNIEIQVKAIDNRTDSLSESNDSSTNSNNNRGRMYCDYRKRTSCQKMIEHMTHILVMKHGPYMNNLCRIINVSIINLPAHIFRLWKYVCLKTFVAAVVLTVKNAHISCILIHLNGHISHKHIKYQYTFAQIDIIK